MLTYPPIPSLLAFLCVWLSPKVMEGLPASMGKNPPKKYRHLFIYKTEHGIARRVVSRSSLGHYQLILKERNTVTVGIHKGCLQDPLDTKCSDPQVP